MPSLSGLAATNDRFAVIKITSVVLALLFFSFSISPVLANPERAPELETITFIDVFRPTDVANPPNDADGTCSAQSSSFKTIRGGIRWREFPVEYSINTANSGVVPAKDAVDAVIRAAASWDFEEHPAGQFFSKVDTGADVAIRWAFIDGPSGTLAVTSISFNPATKTIASATITFDSADDWTILPTAVSCGDQGDAHDVENVGAHELGHVVGLDHVNDDTRLTMYKFITQIGETMKRTLGPGDREGILALYGEVIEEPPEDPPEDDFCPPGHERRGLCIP